jgi:hypothetical protein
MTIAEQSLRAREEFPNLVANSKLFYGRSDVTAPNIPNRWLIALAPTFSLIDMRFADILNDVVPHLDRNVWRLEVFDIDDTVSVRPLWEYFPGLADTSTTPVAGVWTNGVHIQNWLGTAAINQVLQSLGIPTNAAEIARSVRPPDPRLFEERQR